MTPADKYFMDLYHLASRTSTHPMNPKNDEELVLYDKCAFEMESVPGLPNWVHVIAIRALNPGSGWGTKGLKAIARLADKHQVVLFGKIIPFGSKTMSLEKLRKWYTLIDAVMISPTMCIRPLVDTDINDFYKIDPLTMEKIQKGQTSWEHLQSKRSLIDRTFSGIEGFVKKWF